MIIMSWWCIWMAFYFSTFQILFFFFLKINFLNILLSFFLLMLLIINVFFGFVSSLFLLLFDYLEWMKTNMMNEKKQKQKQKQKEINSIVKKIHVWMFSIDFKIVFFRWNREKSNWYYVLDDLVRWMHVKKREKKREKEKKKKISLYGSLSLSIFMWYWFTMKWWNIIRLKLQFNWFYFQISIYFHDDMMIHDICVLFSVSFCRKKTRKKFFFFFFLFRSTILMSQRDKIRFKFHQKWISRSFWFILNDSNDKMK